MYYTIVVIIAIILLITILTITGVLITSNMNNKPFPDYINNCPDYWKMTTDNNNSICYPPESGINIPDNSNFLGSNPSIVHSGVNLNEKKDRVISIELDNSKWIDICDKNNWAKQNGVLWDGISNYNLC